MKRIKIFMSVFLSLFVMVTLQSCEKETAEVTEFESQEDVTQTDKPLEKESGVATFEYFEWGTLTKTDDHVAIDLYSDYYFTDLYVDYIRECGENDCTTIPVDVGTNMRPEYTFYERYIVFRAKRYTSGMEVIKDLYVSHEKGCMRKGFSLVKCFEGPGYTRFCGFNLNVSGSRVYLCKKTGTGTNGAIRRIRIVFHTDRFYAQKMLLDDGYVYDTTNTNEGVPSPIRVYIGWRYY